MKRKIITLALLAAFLLTGGIAMVLGKEKTSLWERRQLAQWPSLTWASVSSGSFMSSAEKAAADQFPFRDGFRRYKALYLHYAMGQLDNNDIYVSGGSAAKLDYPLNTDSVERVIRRILEIQNTWLAGTNTRCYYSVVPDKNVFLASRLGYPCLDWDALLRQLQQGLEMEYIDIASLLEVEDYYRTDPHWRQERLQPVAEALAEAMGASLVTDFTAVPAGTFSGAYTGQSALPLKPDEMYYLESGPLADCTAYDQVRDEEIPIYDLEKFQGRDPYDLFLGGAAPIQVIENPNAKTQRELILFRDSYGSSVAPLLACCYRSVTLIDLRYVSMKDVWRYVSFDNQDVLFLYSTLILNHSESLK